MVLLTDGPCVPFISGCSDDEFDTTKEVSQQPESPLGMAGELIRGTVYVGNVSDMVTPVASFINFSATSRGPEIGIR